MRSAVISEDGVYRYDLVRRWSDEIDHQLRLGDDERLLLWVMLNPSTADANVDDPTIRRIIGFSRREGYDGLVVCNLFAFRSPRPQDLPADYAVATGPQNHARLAEWVRSPLVDRVVVAWGASRPKLPRAHVEGLAHFARKHCACLGWTKSGDPVHPLYQPADQPLYTFARAGWRLDPTPPCGAVMPLGPGVRGFRTCARHADHPDEHLSEADLVRLAELEAMP